ncbi:hypothetical protein D3C80_1754380 [compost metagenome]
MLLRRCSTRKVEEETPSKKWAVSLFSGCCGSGQGFRVKAYSLYSAVESWMMLTTLTQSYPALLGRPGPGIFSLI